jgi:hypothetical protein
MGRSSFALREICFASVKQHPNRRSSLALAFEIEIPIHETTGDMLDVNQTDQGDSC